MVEIGDKIKIINLNYKTSYPEHFEAIYTVEAVFGPNDGHPYYDTGVGGLLVEVEEVEFCFYDYEFEIQ